MLQRFPNKAAQTGCLCVPSTPRASHWHSLFTKANSGLRRANPLLFSDIWRRTTTPSDREHSDSGLNHSVARFVFPTDCRGSPAIKHLRGNVFWGKTKEVLNIRTEFSRYSSNCTNIPDRNSKPTIAGVLLRGEARSCQRLAGCPLTPGLPPPPSDLGERHHLQTTFQLRIFKILTLLKKLDKRYLHLHF